MESLKESDLYGPVRDYLAKQGYRVNAEVKDCDITAIRGDELVVVELKTSFNATLLIQATDRQRMADAVYIALPHPRDKKRLRNWNGMCHLLKRLELGLLLVHFLRSGPRVEVAFHPTPWTVRRQHTKRKAIIREIHDRSGEYNVGGTNREKRVTAYRETAIHIACCLEKYGELSPSTLVRLGTGARTQGILSKNFYGWFERVEKGVYRLHTAGKDALREYPQIASFFQKKLQETLNE